MAGPERSVVVKSTTPVEVAALRAVAVVRGVDRPRLLAAGPDWVVVPHYGGPPLSEGPDVPEVWTTPVRVHAHRLRKRPAVSPWRTRRWRVLCRDRVLPHVRAAHERTGDDRFAAAAVYGWAEDARMLTVLPRTLVHGDAHRGNILLAAGGRAEARANVGYMGFAADHLGAVRVAEPAAGAQHALTRPTAALDVLLGPGLPRPPR